LYSGSRFHQLISIKRKLCCWCWWKCIIRCGWNWS